MKFTITATRKASHPFPFDMLRRDRCFPATVEDAVMIDRVSANRMAGLPPQILIHLETDLNQFPNEERWKSFGWTVNVDG